MKIAVFALWLMANAYFSGPLGIPQIAAFAVGWFIGEIIWFLLERRRVRAIGILLLALFASSCTTPTAPTTRNVDGTPHVAGSPLQPWISTDVQTGNFHLKETE